MADATLLSWINAEVERALLLVRDCIARFTAAPEDADALRPCPEHLHQVSGALRMVGLNGATLVCESIEGSFAGFSSARPSSAAIGIVDRAVLALKDFVGDLARGQADVPLRLYPVYRDLAQLKGTAGVSEKDLFFPDITLRAPPHRRPKTLPADAIPAFVQKQRTLFQRGLLAWLRNPPAGLDDMRRAVNQLHKIAAQLPDPKGIWWVAHGFLDAIETAADAEWLAAAKALGNKIEKQMRGGSATVTESLLRELLYAIGKAKPTTQRLKDVRQLYQIDNLFPRHDAGSGVRLEFDIERLEVALYDLHSRLDALKRSWVQYVSGEHKTAAPFRERVTAFKAKARDLGNQHLIKLLDAIGLVATKLPDPYPRQTQIMVIEMASAFLLVEHVLDNFTNPTADLEQQIAIMGGWLLDAATGKSTGEPPPGVRPDLSERIGALHLRSQVAKEILANLQHVEQVLDAFARDSAKRATLPELQPYMRQMHGALVVLGLGRAAEALAICEKLVTACAAEGHRALTEDMDWIAEGLSSLGFFLEPCRHGREPAEEAIELFFRRYERRGAPPSLDTTMRMKSPVAPSAAPAQPEAPALEFEPAPTAPPKPDARAGVDQDLLAIFLEEADEVLATINKTVAECRARPDDREALITIRRAFHTLKGSGRMVGLMDLGEAGWEVERAMNQWLEAKKPATPSLLGLITAASKSFTGWIAGLREGGLKEEVDASPLVELIAHLDDAPAPPPPSEDTTIGGVTMPRNFFDIYHKEALGHVATLEAQCREWRQMPGAEASHEFMRAAHTLASSSRTAGFPALADLSGVLEHWTGFSARTAAAADGEIVQAAIAKLRWMVDGLAKRQAPAADEETARKLRSLITRVEAQPVPPMEQQKPQLVADAKPAPKETGGREKRVMRDDIDPQLLPIFLEEAQQLVPQLGADLRDWKANTADTKVSDSLRRVLHTFKGSARMAGAIRLGELCHIMETYVEEALEKNAFPKTLWDELEDKMDRLSLEVERMETGAPEEAAPAAPVAAAAAAPLAQPVKAPAGPRAEPQPRPAPPLPSPAATLRVNAETLDYLINESGEVAIARSRAEAELRAVKQALSDLNESISRLRAQLREVEVQADSQMQSRLSVAEEKDREFDPLEFDRYTRLQELTRMMAEGLSDVTSIQQALFKNVGDTDAALLQQARISREVQQGLMRVRAVPFSNLNERLYRIVRQTARELEKKADLAIEGAEVELDRSVLERIGAPLEHMLRNALAHGLESPEARVAAGKPDTGKITISLRQESNEIALVLSDDGAGLDLEKLRRKAQAMGLLAEGEPTEAQLAQLIFVSGLSTADAVSELSGRGVGMDVVKNEITAIGGRVEIATTRGQGTSFAIHLPLTLAVTQVVLVRAGSTVVAISSAMVEQVLRLKADALAEIYGKQSVGFQDRVYPLRSLHNLLGSPGTSDAQDYNSVLLLRSGIQRIALHVDELIGNEEIVVKNIGPQIARLPGVAGATVLADGAIVLIVNPVQMAAAARARTTAVVEQPQATVPAASPTVMVVDDSLTVRRITSRLLEREGYRVLLAKDGVDALEQMKDALPGVLLVDIEMPRMDGFDLTRNVRADARLQGIPIIIISSRTAEKHRSRAAELGVNAFLGKPYQESELLQHIAQHLSRVKFELQETIGKYPVLREIGSGATSRVYLARDPFADKDVAIKVLLPGKGADPETERMQHKSFMTEASLAGKLNHPHIVDIYDAVIEPERSYLVMEYVPGVTLESHSSVANLLPVGKVVEIIFKCIRALEYAHNHGIIHRDIKPGNILLSKDGETKVSDFGAAFQQRQGLETSQMTGIGSPAYMSPEQIRMEALNQQTDIYSLGITMFRLLTGRLPFEATSYPSLTHAVLNVQPPAPSTLRPSLPPLLDQIVAKATAKDPAERYKSWLAFGKDLSQAFISLRLAGESISESEKFDKLRAMPFFKGFGDVALWEVVRIGTWNSIQANSVIIREGEQGDSFFLLIDGEVSVTLLNKPIATIKPGGCFGELLYFAERSERRTTTITSLGPIVVMEIKAKALDAATDGCQVGFNKAFMKVLIDRLVHANRMIAQL